MAGDESPRPVRALAEGWESTVQETSFCSVYKQFLPKADCQDTWRRFNVANVESVGYFMIL